MIINNLFSAPTCPDFPPFYNGEIYYPDGKRDHQISHAVEVG